MGNNEVNSINDDTSMTIAENLKRAVQLLKQANVEESVRLSKMLLAHIIKKSKEYLVIHSSEELQLEIEQEYNRKIEEIIKGKPIQYITGHQEFMKLDFLVNENVLIPQPDTEILVEEILNLCNEDKEYKILDLCTGSGIIGISIAKYIEKCDVTLVDISNLALEVAKKNLEYNKISNKVEIIQSDMFNKVEGKFDVIASNPPYIETDVICTLPKDVQNEPIIALDGGKDGLNFYRDIAQNAYKFLNKNGYLCLEIGYKQKNKIINILEETKKYENIYYKKDLSGNNRVIIAKVR